MAKRFHLNAFEIRQIATRHGACVATDQITLEGKQVSDLSIIPLLTAPIGSAYGCNPEDPEFLPEPIPDHLRGH